MTTFHLGEEVNYFGEIGIIKEIRGCYATIKIQNSYQKVIVDDLKKVKKEYQPKPDNRIKENEIVNLSDRDAAIRFFNT